MIVRNVHLEPNSEGFRATAWVESSRPGGLTGELFYEVQGQAVLPSLEMAATAFLVAALPTAVWLGEDLECIDPCDQEFMLRVGKIANAIARMHHLPHRIQVSAPVATSEPRPDRIVGMSFSGGVDSFYTLYANRDPKGLTPVGALVTALGFDTRLDDFESHRELIERLRVIADAENLRYFPIRTNFRNFFKPYADWASVTHGACIVSLAFLLSGELKTYLIPSSYPIDRLFPWASHALIDNAYVSSHTRVINDGWDVHRNEKLPALADWDLAMNHIRVCARAKATSNCGICEKCIRTKTLLYLNGRLDRFVAKDTRFGPEILGKVKLKTERSIKWYEELAEIAKRNPEHAWVVRAIRKAIRSGKLRVMRRQLLRR